jgi:hypothetical protein
MNSRFAYLLLLIALLAAAMSADAAAAKKSGGGKDKEVTKSKEKFTGDKNDPVIGIDLGTTYSCVAVFKEGDIEIVANDLGERTTPSWVAFTDSERLIGQAAKNQVHKNPKNTLYDIKRLIGRGFDDVEVQKDIKAFPFSVIDRNGKPYLSVKSQGKTQNMSPEEVSAMVLTRMRGELLCVAVVAVCRSAAHACCRHCRGVRRQAHQARCHHRARLLHGGAAAGDEERRSHRGP